MVALAEAIALALVGAVLGAEYDMPSPLNLPSVPVCGNTATTAGIIALIAAVLVPLLGAVLGGRLGTRNHRNIDPAGV